mgnify:CR=1 FL=1
MFDNMGWIVALGLASIGAIVEVLRLEGRLNSHDVLFTEKEKAITLVATLNTERYLDLKERLGRIERKLDAINSGPASH